MANQWEQLLQTVTALVNAAAPIVGVAVPGLGAAIVAAQKILVGVAAAEPAAVALFNRITTGQNVTPEELAQYIAVNEASYTQALADIDAKLAAMPKPSAP